jgi:hypothetical protein
MTIVLESAPVDIEQHASNALKSIGWWFAKCEPFGGPFGAYYCSAGEVTASSLAEIKPSNWMFFIEKGKTYRILEMDGETGKEINCLNEPHVGDDLLTTVTSLVTFEPVIPTEDYLRLIEIPALHIRALWLKDAGKYPKQDRFTVFGWYDYAPIHLFAADFFNFVADQEKQRLLREDEYRAQGHDVDPMGG